MTTKHYSAAETAQIIRTCLKEAFAGIKFRVTSKTYSGGASVNVRWTDGPNAAQVEAIARRFAGSYFDGGIDYKGAVHHMFEGQPVRFGADHVFCTREYSNGAVERAIARFARRFASNLWVDGVEVPTVEQYLSGELRAVRLSGLFDAVDFEIRAILAKSSDRMGVKSKTAARFFITHDDGYGRSCGTGSGAVGLAAVQG